MIHQDDDDIELSSIEDDKNGFDLPAISNSISQILQAIGEDPTREGLVRTPDRVARAYQEILAGYHVDPVKLVKGTLLNVN